MALLLAFALLPLASAQTTSFLYKWAFQDASIQTQIPACQALPIVVSSFDTTTNDTSGTPPYYITAFAVDSIPSTTLIGTSNDNLAYTIDYPAGTRLLLSVTDSNGSPGGTHAVLTVVDGPNTDCVRNRTNTPQFAINSNVTTGRLETCEPWGLSIFGGTSPYTVSLVAANSPAVTNVTLPEGHNIYTYINRAEPDGEFLAAISDATGRWASHTPLVTTFGPAADTCSSSLVSSSRAGSVSAPPPVSSPITTPTPTPTPPSQTSPTKGTSTVTQTVDDPAQSGTGTGAAYRNNRGVGTLFLIPVVLALTVL